MRLLLADAHVMFLHSLAKSLEQRAHQVAATADPTALVDLARRSTPDVCVLDADFGGSCADRAADVRRASPHSRVLLLAGSPQHAPAVSAFESGAVHGLVAKASTLETLERALERVATGARTADPLVRLADDDLAVPPTTDLLTTREREVLVLLAQGLSTAAMAVRLGVTQHTVRTHVQSVYDKLHVHHRTKAARIAHDLGLLREPPR